jgi:hypothetical protein
VALASVITDETYVPATNQIIAVAKIESAASSVNEMPREAPKVSKVLSLRARGMGRALARWADRPMLRRKKGTRREKVIVKDCTRRGDGRMVK